MVKCPFCGFANEDGALFCEQCKSDVSGVASAPAEAAPAADAPIMAAVVVEEPVVAVAVVEEEPVMAAIVETPPAEEVKVEPAVAEAAPPPLAPEPAVAAPPPEPMPVAPAIAPAAAAAAAPAAAKPAAALPPGSQPKLVVLRGLKVNEEYSLFPGDNYVGRADEKPVDIDLTFQEPEDRVWTSRQHALLVFDDVAGILTVEDLNSANGTFVNRERVYPGQPKQLSVGSTVQIGTVHMRVKV